MLFRSLAAHAHAGAMAQTARSLLAKAQARDATGLPGVFEIPADDD